MAILLLLLAVALALGGYFFSVQNTQPVDLALLFGYRLVGAPLWTLVVVPALAGLVVGLLLGLPARVRFALARRRLLAQVAERDRTIRRLEDDLAAARGDLSAAGRRSTAGRGDDLPQVPDVPDTTRRSRANAA